MLWGKDVSPIAQGLSDDWSALPSEPWSLMMYMCPTGRGQHSDLHHFGLPKTQKNIQETRAGVDSMAEQDTFPACTRL